MYKVWHSPAVFILMLQLCVCCLMIPAVSLADRGDSTLYTLTHVKGDPGGLHPVTLGINTVYDIGGFNFLFQFESGALTVEDVSLDGTRSEGLPVYAADAVNSSPSVIAGLVIYVPPAYVPAGDGPMFNLFLRSNSSIPKGSLLPLIFFNEPEPYGRINEISDPGGTIPYSADFYYGSILFGIDRPYPIFDLGDANLNGIPYELVDLFLMQTQLGPGIDEYIDEEEQTRNSDINCDLMPWTIADMVFMEDITTGALLPPVGDEMREIVFMQGDSIWFDGYSGTPMDTLDVPVYFANELPAGGISFKLDYSPGALHYVSCSTQGSRIPPEWDIVVGTERNDGMMFYAAPFASGSPQDFQIVPGEGLLVTLRFAVVHPVSNQVDIKFERLQTYEETNGYASFDDPWWNYASLQQIDSDIWFSFIWGDADGSGNIDIDDVVYLIEYIFQGGPAPPIYDMGDFDRNFFVDVDDVTALMEFIF